MIEHKVVQELVDAADIESLWEDIYRGRADPSDLRSAMLIFGNAVAARFVHQAKHKYDEIA